MPRSSDTGAEQRRQRPSLAGAHSTSCKSMGMPMRAESSRPRRPCIGSRCILRYATDERSGKTSSKILSTQDYGNASSKALSGKAKISPRKSLRCMGIFLAMFTPLTSRARQPSRKRSCCPKARPDLVSRTNTSTHFRASAMLSGRAAVRWTRATWRSPGAQTLRDAALAGGAGRAEGCPRAMPPGRRPPGGSRGGKG